jgi:cytochrome c oxidase subunit 3
VAQADAACSEGAKEPQPASNDVATAEAPAVEAQSAAEAGTNEAQAAPPEGVDAPATAPTVKKAELSNEAWLQRQINALTYEERHPLEMAGVIRAPADGPLEFARPAKAGIFFSIYFFMTGLHGLHVLIGIGLWVWMLFIANKREMGAKYFGPIEFTALYWHLVDLIWIYLFPMLYLIH